MAMKFRAHDTFFIRKGWLSKGMERVVEKPDLFVVLPQLSVSFNLRIH